MDFISPGVSAPPTQKCRKLLFLISFFAGLAGFGLSSSANAQVKREKSSAKSPSKGSKSIKKEAKMKTEIATLAGGCFWGVEELLRQLKGVKRTEVGYTGGHTLSPAYEDVKKGTTGHAEAIEVEFDPAIVSYEEILKYFFRLHDPTTLNRQGNDIGTQYRSSIFYHSPEQHALALKIKNEIDKSGKWKKPLTTEIVAATPFYPAETYHQDYLQKNPGGYTCHYLRD